VRLRKRRNHIPILKRTKDLVPGFLVSNSNCLQHLSSNAAPTGIYIPSNHQIGAANWPILFSTR
jgi:hypothetical protein